MDYKSSDFKKLLDKLQEESWQLELVISGFSIYGLFVSLEPIGIAIIETSVKGQGVYSFLLAMLNSSIYVLLTVLMVHVVLRGLWIGSLGLRYVSGEIIYDSLGYSEKFTNFLKEKSGSFDRYIARLENICSTLFPLAFLMIFYLLSYFIAFGIIPIAVIYFFTQTEWFGEGTGKTLSTIFAVIYVFASFIILIDFLGMGVLKRNKKVAKIYFPLYKLFGYLTLSILYRPLLYNFLDQKKTRWLATFTLPVYLLVMGLISFFGDINSNYVLKFPESTASYTHIGNYEDRMTEADDFVETASISSEIIEKPYLKLFLLFKEDMEDAVFEKDSTLIPENDSRGLGILPKHGSSAGGAINVSLSWERPKTEKYIRRIAELHKLKIDDKTVDKDFLLTTNTKGQLGFNSYLDLEDLSKGKHTLRIIGPKKVKKEFKTDTLATIPFWYFPSEQRVANEAPKPDIK